MIRSEIEKILRDNKLELLREELNRKPQLVRKLIGFLYHPELEIRDSAARSFGIVAEILPEEKLKDLLRRFLWMLNDESGSCCWHVPYAFGEIGYSKPEIIEDFIGCFSYYAEDPDETLSTGVKAALKRINESGREFKAEGYVVFRGKETK